MGRKKKEFNKDGIFQIRFRALCYESGRTQEQLARILDVSRPTVAGWLEGKNIPDIISLTRIAEHFHVSSDYLLGLSDTMSADVNVKAAMEYTGLSEGAVEWLHAGLDEFECDGKTGLDEQSKKENWAVVSALIQDSAFTKMIRNLKEIALEAYLEKILKTLCDDYSDCDLPEEDPDFRYANKEDRDIVVANHVHVLTMKRPWDKERIEEWVYGMDDNALSCDVARAMFAAEESNELHQFHAAKAFTGYIDRLVEKSYGKAEQRFEKL